jgi:hypothetical protein
MITTEDQQWTPCRSCGKLVRFTNTNGKIRFQHQLPACPEIQAVLDKFQVNCSTGVAEVDESVAEEISGIWPKPT